MTELQHGRHPHLHLRRHLDGRNRRPGPQVTQGRAGIADSGARFDEERERRPILKPPLSVPCRQSAGETGQKGAFPAENTRHTRGGTENTGRVRVEKGGDRPGGARVPENYDPEMTRVVLSAFEMKKNQFILSHAALHFSRGLVEMKSFPVSRNELEGFLKDYALRLSPPMALVPISPPYAGYLIEEASGFSGKEADEARVSTACFRRAEGRKRPEDIYLLPTPDTASGLPQTLFSPTRSSILSRPDGPASRKTGKSSTTWSIHR